MKGRRKRIVRPRLAKKPFEPESEPELLAAQLTLLELADAYWEDGDAAGARRACERVLATRPLSPGRRARANGLLAQVLLADGDVGAARAALADALEHTADAEQHTALHAQLAALDAAAPGATDAADAA